MTERSSNGGPRGRRLVGVMAALQIAWLLAILWARAAASPSKVVALLLWTTGVGLVTWFTPARLVRHPVRLARALLRRELLLVVLLGALVIAVGVPYAGQPNFSFPDEVEVAACARIIASDGLPSFFDRYGTIGWLARQHPPLMPLVYGLGSRLFGGGLVGLRLICLGFGVGLIVVTYLLGRSLYDRPTGLAACLALLAFPYFFRLATVALLDVPLALSFNLLLLIVLAWCRRPDRARGITAGIVFGAGLLTKYVMVLAGPLAFAWTVIHRRASTLGRPLAVMLTVAALMLAAWLLTAHRLGILSDQATRLTRFSRFATTSVRDPSVLFETMVTRLPSGLGVYSLAPIVGSVWFLSRRRSTSDLSVLIAVGGVFLPVALTLPDARYFFPAFPMLAIAAAAWSSGFDEEAQARIASASLLHAAGTLWLFWDWQRQTLIFLG